MSTFFKRLFSKSRKEKLNPITDSEINNDTTIKYDTNESFIYDKLNNISDISIESLRDDDSLYQLWTNYCSNSRDNTSKEDKDESLISFFSRFYEVYINTSDNLAGHPTEVIFELTVCFFNIVSVEQTYLKIKKIMHDTNKYDSLETLPTILFKETLNKLTILLKCLFIITSYNHNIDILINKVGDNFIDVLYSIMLTSITEIESLISTNTFTEDLYGHITIIQLIVQIFSNSSMINMSSKSIFDNYPWADDNINHIISLKSVDIPNKITVNQSMNLSTNQMTVQLMINSWNTKIIEKGIFQILIYLLKYCNYVSSLLTKEFSQMNKAAYSQLISLQYCLVYCIYVYVSSFSIKFLSSIDLDISINQIILNLPDLSTLKLDLTISNMISCRNLLCYYIILKLQALNYDVKVSSSTLRKYLIWCQTNYDNLFYDISDDSIESNIESKTNSENILDEFEASDNDKINKFILSESNNMNEQIEIESPLNTTKTNLNHDFEAEAIDCINKDNNNYLTKFSNKCLNKCFIKYNAKYKYENITNFSTNFGPSDNLSNNLNDYFPEVNSDDNIDLGLSITETNELFHNNSMKMKVFYDYNNISWYKTYPQYKIYLNLFNVLLQLIFQNYTNIENDHSNSIFNTSSYNKDNFFSITHSFMTIIVNVDRIYSVNRNTYRFSRRYDYLSANTLSSITESKADSDNINIPFLQLFIIKLLSTCLSINSKLSIDMISSNGLLNAIVSNKFIYNYENIDFISKLSNDLPSTDLSTYLQNYIHLDKANNIIVEIDTSPLKYDSFIYFIGMTLNDLIFQFLHDYFYIYISKIMLDTKLNNKKDIIIDDKIDKRKSRRKVDNKIDSSINDINISQPLNELNSIISILLSNINQSMTNIKYYNINYILIYQTTLLVHLIYQKYMKLIYYSIDLISNYISICNNINYKYLYNRNIKRIQPTILTTTNNKSFNAKEWISWSSNLQFLLALTCFNENNQWINIFNKIVIEGRKSIMPQSPKTSTSQISTENDTKHLDILLLLLLDVNTRNVSLSMIFSMISLACDNISINNNKDFCITILHKLFDIVSYTRKYHVKIYGYNQSILIYKMLSYFIFKFKYSDSVSGSKSTASVNTKTSNLEHSPKGSKAISIIFNSNEIISHLLFSISQCARLSASDTINTLPENLRSYWLDLRIQVIRQAYSLLTLLLINNKHIKNIVNNVIINNNKVFPSSRSITRTSSFNDKSLDVSPNNVISPIPNVISPIPSYNVVSNPVINVMTSFNMIDILTQVENIISFHTILLLFEMLLELPIISDINLQEYQSLNCNQSSGILYSSDSILLKGLFNDDSDRPKIKNYLVIYFIIKLFPNIIDDIQIFILQTLINLITGRASLINLSTYCQKTPALLDLLIEIFPTTNDTVQDYIIILITTIGKYSISVSQIKSLFYKLKLNDNKDLRHSYTAKLLQAIKGMFDESNGPQHIFIFDGNTSGLLLPSIVSWPSKKGISFSVWLRIEAPKQSQNKLINKLRQVDSSKVDLSDINSTFYGQEYRPYIFSLRTTSGVGLELCLRSQSTLLNTFRISLNYYKENGDVVAFSKELKGMVVNEGIWHFISISINTSKNEACVLLDEQYCKDKFIFNGMPNNILYPMIGDCPKELHPPNINTNLRGEMGTIYFFSDPLSEGQMRSIQALGPTYFYCFEKDSINYRSVYSNLTTKKQTVDPSTILDGTLNSQIILNLNPAVYIDRYRDKNIHINHSIETENYYDLVTDKYVIDNTPITNLYKWKIFLSSKTFSNIKSMGGLMLEGTYRSMKYSVNSSMHSLGGILVLLPLFYQIKLKQEKYLRLYNIETNSFDSTLSIDDKLDQSLLLSIFQLIYTILDNSIECISILKLMNGFKLIAQLLENIPKIYLTVDVLREIINIYNKLVYDPITQYTCIDNILCNLTIWNDISSSRNIQIVQEKLVDWLVMYSQSNPALLNSILSNERLLYYISKYYSPEINNNTSNNVIPLTLLILIYCSYEISTSKCSTTIFNDIGIDMVFVNHIRKKFFILLRNLMTYNDIVLPSDVVILVSYIISLNSKQSIYQIDSMTYLISLLSDVSSSIPGYILLGLASDRCIFSLLSLHQSSFIEVRLLSLCLYCKVITLSTYFKLLPSIPSRPGMNSKILVNKSVNDLLPYATTLDALGISTPAFYGITICLQDYLLNPLSLSDMTDIYIDNYVSFISFCYINTMIGRSINDLIDTIPIFSNQSNNYEILTNYLSTYRIDMISNHKICISSLFVTLLHFISNDIISVTIKLSILVSMKSIITEYDNCNEVLTLKYWYYHIIDVINKSNKYTQQYEINALDDSVNPSPINLPNELPTNSPINLPSFKSYGTLSNLSSYSPVNIPLYPFNDPKVNPRLSSSSYQSSNHSNNNQKKLYEKTKAISDVCINLLTDLVLKGYLIGKPHQSISFYRLDECNDRSNDLSSYVVEISNSNRAIGIVITIEVINELINNNLFSVAYNILFDLSNRLTKNEYIQLSNESNNYMILYFQNIWFYLTVVLDFVDALRNNGFDINKLVYNICLQLSSINNLDLPKSDSEVNSIGIYWLEIRLIAYIFNNYKNKSINNMTNENLNTENDKLSIRQNDKEIHISDEQLLLYINRFIFIDQYNSSHHIGYNWLQGQYMTISILTILNYINKNDQPIIYTTLTSYFIYLIDKYHNIWSNLINTVEFDLSNEDFNRTSLLSTNEYNNDNRNAIFKIDKFNESKTGNNNDITVLIHNKINTTSIDTNIKDLLIDIIISNLSPNRKPNSLQSNRSSIAEYLPSSISNLLENQLINRLPTDIPNQLLWDNVIKIVIDQLEIIENNYLIKEYSNLSLNRFVNYNSIVTKYNIDEMRISHDFSVKCNQSFSNICNINTSTFNNIELNYKSSNNINIQLITNIFNKLENDRGPWGNYINHTNNNSNSKNNIYWKLDRIHTYKYMYPRLIRNYEGSNHNIASDNTKGKLFKSDNNDSLNRMSVKVHVKSIKSVNDDDNDDDNTILKTNPSIMTQTIPNLSDNLNSNAINVIPNSSFNNNLNTQAIISNNMINNQISSKTNSSSFDLLEDEVLFSCSCEIVTSSTTSSGSRNPGTLKLSKSRLLFQRNKSELSNNNDIDQNYDFVNKSNNKQFLWAVRCLSSLSWNITDIISIVKRRYHLRPIAIEILLSSHTTIFISLHNKINMNKIYKLLLYYIRIKNKFYKPIITIMNSSFSTFLSTPYTNQFNSISYDTNIHDTLKLLTNLWVNREISNYDYLSQLNFLSGRSYNDIAQYPIFPWVLKDYTSNRIDLKNPLIYRNFNYLMNAQLESQRQILIDKYNSFLQFEQDTPPYHNGSHYSTSGFVMWYLIRLEPFTSYHIWLQEGKLDHPDRLFHSIANTYNNCINSSMDMKELIPEFFYNPIFLENNNNIDFGTMQSGDKVDNVILPPWAKDAEDFIRIHREALESDYVSLHIHEWIDLIFGYKQRPPYLSNGDQSCIDSLNSFIHWSYPDAIDLNEIESSDPLLYQTIIKQIDNFGQMPMQLFTKPHPTRLTFDKISYIWPIASIIEGIHTIQPILAKDSKSNLVPTNIVIDRPKNIICFEVIKVSNYPIVFIHEMISSDKLITIDTNRFIGLHAFKPLIPDVIPPYTYKIDPLINRMKSNQRSSNKDRKVGIQFASRGLLYKHTNKYSNINISIDNDNKNNYILIENEKFKNKIKKEKFNSLSINISTNESVNSKTNSPMNKSINDITIDDFNKNNKPNSFPSINISNNITPNKNINNDIINDISPNINESFDLSNNNNDQLNLLPNSLTNSPDIRKPKLKKSISYSTNNSDITKNSDDVKNNNNIKYLSNHTDEHITSNLFDILIDYKLIFTCGHWDNSFRISNIETGKLIQSICLHNDVVTCLRIASDYNMNWLITGSRDCTVIVWELNVSLNNNGLSSIVSNPLHILHGHDDAIISLDVNSEYDLICSGSEDGTIILYTLRQGLYIRSIIFGIPNSINSTKLLPIHMIILTRHFRIIAYSQYNNLICTYSINGKLLCKTDTNERLYTMILSEDHRVLLTGGERCLIVMRWVDSLLLANTGPRKSLDTVLDGYIDKLFNKNNDSNYFQSSIRSLYLTDKERLLIVGLESGELRILTQDPAYLRTRLYNNLIGIGIAEIKK